MFGSTNMLSHSTGIGSLLLVLYRPVVRRSPTAEWYYPLVSTIRSSQAARDR